MAKLKNKIMHVITWLLLGATVAFGVFYFGMPILQRLWMAVCDLGRSLAAYVILLFTWEESIILPTVQEFPETMDTVLPLTWEEFEIFLDVWWENIINKKILLSYLWTVLENITLTLSWISLMMLPAASLALLLWLCNRGIDNNYNKSTKAVRGFERFRRKVWWRIKATIKEYLGFLKKRWWYLLALAILWAYNLNILTIALEAVAWIFYIAWAGTLESWTNILVQIAKFAIDFSVAALFIPGWMWFLGSYALFHAWRCHLGIKNLKKLLEKDDKIIDKYPGGIFVNGKQRSKKTSMLAMLKLLYERKYRTKAGDKLHDRDCQFPFFPWINLERFLKKAMSEHKIYMLYHCRRLARQLRAIHKKPAEKRAPYMRILRRKYRYEYDDPIFGYDEQYGLTYNDGLVEIDIFDAIEAYLQLFFIYSQEDPLDQSNLSVREDYTWDSHGNFPIWDGDLFKKDAAESKAASKYSHIIDFDAFRLGMKFDPDNPNKDAIEFGIGIVQEAGKERKNQKTRAAAGNKAEGEKGFATQDNDGFEIDLKVRGQIALVDFYDFWVWLIDDQRANDLGASAGELMNKFFIKGPAQEYFVLPFFEVEELLFGILSKIYKKLHRYFRKRKGSNTLLHHLLKVIYRPISRAYDRLQKKYTAWKLRVKVTDGGDGEEMGEEEFWILSFVTYRQRFASDVCKAFYEYRFKKSKRGVIDMPCYTDINPGVELMLQQNSYFTEDMTVYNGIDSKRRRVVQKGKRGKIITDKPS